jgi:hypothetical protein
MKFRMDKVTENEIENIRFAKQQLENSSARVRAVYGFSDASENASDSN